MSRQSSNLPAVVADQELLARFLLFSGWPKATRDAQKAFQKQIALKIAARARLILYESEEND